jgi:hypothetical protein
MPPKKVIASASGVAKVARPLKLKQPASKMLHPSSLRKNKRPPVPKMIHWSSFRPKPKPVAAAPPNPKPVATAAPPKKLDGGKKKPAGPIVVHSNRSKDVDVCAPCTLRMSDSLRAILALTPVRTSEDAAPPVVFCDVCRINVQTLAGPPTLTSVLVNLKSQLEALGTASVDGLVTAALSAPRTPGDLVTLHECLQLGGYKPALATRVLASVNKLTAAR